MSTPEEEELRRRARAIWGYSMLEQGDFAKEAGVPHNTLRQWLGRTRQGPNFFEVLNLAKAASVPREFVERGFEDLRTSDLLLRQQVADNKAQLARIEASIKALSQRGEVPPALDPPDSILREPSDDQSIPGSGQPEQNPAEGDRPADAS